MVMALGMLVNERLIRVGVGWPTARTNRARLGLRHCQKAATPAANGAAAFAQTGKSPAPV